VSASAGRVTHRLSFSGSPDGGLRRCAPNHPSDSQRR
jgi:hypothetical protein